MIDTTLSPCPNACRSPSRTSSICKTFWWVPIHSHPSNSLSEIQEPNRFVLQKNMYGLNFTYYCSCQLQHEGLKTSNFLLFVTLFIYYVSEEELFCGWRFLSFNIKCLQNVEYQKILSSILKIWNVSMFW